MKKLFAIVLALVLCFGVLSVGAFAADYDYVTVTGTMNDWNTSSEADRMTKVSDGVYTITYENMAAGTYAFKFTANGSWDALNLGGSFMGSGVESDLYWSGADITFTVEEACDVTIDLDINNYKFTLTIGDRVDEAPTNIKIHITAPAEWTEVYAYVWGPEHLGSWAGTKVENGVVEVTAAFEGMVISNGNGTQSWDIKDIDLTKEEVWITVHADGSYTLSYDGGSDEDPAPDARPIKIHVTAAHWNAIYAYTYNPEQNGTWPGTLVENGEFETLNIFEGLVLSNGEGQQTADIKDIDLTKEEVWITVNADNGFSISYEAPAGEDQVPAVDIKINVTAAHWNAIYAYTYNPEQNGTWPGTLVENGVFEIPANFEGLVLNNGEGQQTADIKDIDLTKAEVWITVNADNSFSISYEAPVVNIPGGDPNVPSGDNILACAMALLLSAAGLIVVSSKKEI